MKSNSKYITLKEAAEISGYAPDYIGQLIRKGKLPGKQVYFNVAWMTTREDLQNYMNKKAGGKGGKESLWDKIVEFKARLFLESQMTKLFKILLYFSITICILFGLLLFYIFSVTLEKKLEQRAESKAQQSAPEIQIQNTNSTTF